MSVEEGARHPTPADRRRWREVAPARGPGPVRETLAELVGGPCAGHQRIEPRVLATSIRHLPGGPLHRYVRTSETTFDYVGSW